MVYLFEHWQYGKRSIIRIPAHNETEACRIYYNAYKYYGKMVGCEVRRLNY